MAEVRLTDAAKYDLWEIYSYYAIEGDVGVADRIRNEFLEKFELLSSNNLIGTPRSERHPNLRSFAHRKYLIFYFPTEFGVEIFRVLHSARDIDQIFESDGGN